VVTVNEEQVYPASVQNTLELLARAGAMRIADEEVHTLLVERECFEERLPPPDIAGAEAAMVGE
jgi:hypothetical protein